MPNFKEKEGKLKLSKLTNSLGLKLLKSLYNSMAETMIWGVRDDDMMVSVSAGPRGAVGLQYRGPALENKTYVRSWLIPLFHVCGSNRGFLCGSTTAENRGWNCISEKVVWQSAWSVRLVFVAWNVMKRPTSCAATDCVYSELYGWRESIVVIMSEAPSVTVRNLPVGLTNVSTE